MIILTNSNCEQVSAGSSTDNLAAGLAGTATFGASVKAGASLGSRVGAVGGIKGAAAGAVVGAVAGTFVYLANR